MFTKSFDRKVWLALGIVAVSVGMGTALTLHAAWPTRIRVGYAPEQPIKFSHQLHSGSMGIECRYCHTGVDTGPHATIPPVSTCMNCHTVFQGNDDNPQQKDRIAQLIHHWENKEPIIWNKVYDLADFVYFDHSRHMASGLDCSNCHGAVRTMEVIQRVTPLTMGWCLECHMGHRTEMTYEDIEGKLKFQTGEQLINDPIYGKIMAPINCSTCHR